MKTNSTGFDSRATRAPASCPVVVAVDDDEDSLVLLSYIVEDLPCSLFCAMDGRAALEMIVALQPDLVLLDVRLPGLSGFDIISSLKGSAATAVIPVVAVTALAGMKYQEKILTAGFDQYVSKPYCLEDIKATVKHYLLACAYNGSRHQCCSDGDHNVVDIPNRSLVFTPRNWANSIEIWQPKERF